MGLIKLLFLADTHLGFDLPFKPRIVRRRRGQDFFRNYERALEPARKGEVHALIHGGDLLYRSRVPARLVDMAMKPLKEIADLGVKIILVPGNHERSRIPYGLLSIHPNISIFRKPATFILHGEQFKLALAGFPYHRNNVRHEFPRILNETGWHNVKNDCDASMLCAHHCFEGATVGPKNYTFRDSDDVIRTSDVPQGLLAVCTGHVHRFQVLTRDLSGRPVAAPVFYPGSIERTSFAEKAEKKGYLKITVQSPCAGAQPVLRWKFLELPTRPMIDIHLSAEHLSPMELKERIVKSLKSCHPEGVVKIHIRGQIKEESLFILRASTLRALSPPGMNVSLRFLKNALSNSAEKTQTKKT